MVDQTVDANKAAETQIQDLNGNKITLEEPSSTDGYAVNQLIARCPPLDTNSVYANILQCDAFSETCVIARQGEKAVGFVSGYRLPKDPSVLFVWQIAVDESARGIGLANKMISSLLGRPGLKSVTHIETTISPGNRPSEKVFERLTEQLSTQKTTQMQYNRADHFDGKHDDETLHRIGPFSLG